MNRASIKPRAIQTAARQEKGSSKVWLNRHAGAEDSIVVFYAGHVTTNGDIRQALVLSDYAMTDLALAHHLSDNAARQQWIILAGCYTGGFTELSQPGRTITAAARADQLAYENLDLGHSYLAWALAPQIAAGSQPLDAHDNADAQIQARWQDRRPALVS